MPHSTTDEPLTAHLEYYAPNADGSPPAPNDLEVQYGKKNLDLAPVQLHDLRAAGDAVTLATHGFQLVHHETTVEDLKDAEKVTTEYYPEVAEVIRKATGATKVLCFNHNIRSTALPRIDPSAQKVEHVGPMRRVHVDVAPGGVTDAVAKRAGPALMSRIQGRWKLINAWKPLRTVERDPLALASGPSVPDEDLVRLQRFRPDGKLSEERYAVKAGVPGAHRWYWVPGQREEEMLLFTQYSDFEDRDERDRVAHCAFVVPGTEDKPVRESIEVRALVIF